MSREKFSRRSFLRNSALFGAGLVGAGGCAGAGGAGVVHSRTDKATLAKKAGQMNVILIICDTVRHDYCGCYGSRWVQTPNIDALACESAVMENFFTGSFPTGPMRKDVQSGRFTFTYTNWSQPAGQEEVLLGPVLTSAGYKTAFIGDTSNSPQFRKGYEYDEVISSEASGIEKVPEQVELPAAARKLRIPMKRITGIVRNAMGWEGEADRRSARTMRAAHRWLEERYTDNKPFFLYVDTFDPHEPWDEPRYYVDRYDPGYRGDELMEPAYEPADYATQREIEHMRCMYAGELTMVDRWVGFLLDGLNQMGLAENTAIILTSDHGFYHGEHNLIGKVLLDREGRICGRWPLYSTISHPPLLVKIPGVTAGERYESFCQPADIMPTILDLMGVSVPSRVQGQSLIPLIEGKCGRLRDAAISSLTYITDAKVRCPSCFRTAEYLYVYGGDEWASELYNLKADPGETRNILPQHPQAAREMHSRHLEFLRKIECPKLSLEAREQFNPAPRANIPYGRVI